MSPLDRAKEASQSGSSSFYDSAIIETYNRAHGVCRQGEVLLHGSVAAISPSRTVSEIKKAPVESSINAITSGILGIGLAALNKKCGLAGTVIGGIAGLVGLKAIADTGLKVSKSKDMQTAMRLAWNHGEQAMMQKSKDLATNALAPEVAQLEIGAISGTVGFKGMHTFGWIKQKCNTMNMWSSLTKKRSEVTHTAHARPESVHDSATARILESVERIECDEQGRLLELPTEEEQLAIIDYLNTALSLDPTRKIRYVVRAHTARHPNRKSIGIGIVGDGPASMPAGKAEKLGFEEMWDAAQEAECESHWRIRNDTGIEVHSWGNEHIDEACVPLSMKFLPDYLYAPDRWISLVPREEFVGVGTCIKDNECGIRPNDIERILLQEFAYRLQLREPILKIAAAFRTVGPRSGSEIEPLILEIGAKDESMAVEPQQMSLVKHIAEELYKHLRCKIRVSSVITPENITYGENRIRIAPQCIRAILGPSKAL